MMFCPRYHGIDKKKPRVGVIPSVWRLWGLSIAAGSARSQGHSYVDLKSTSFPLPRSNKPRLLHYGTMFTSGPVQRVCFPVGDLFTSRLRSRAEYSIPIWGFADGVGTLQGVGGRLKAARRLACNTTISEDSSILRCNLYRVSHTRQNGLAVKHAGYGKFHGARLLRLQRSSCGASA